MDYERIDISRERGVKGYSQLRKSELIDLIESKGSSTDRSNEC